MSEAAETRRTFAGRVGDMFGATARAWGEWAEERRQRRLSRPTDPPHVTVPAWLVRAAKFASWIAMATLVYFLWLYTLDIARDRASPLHVTHAGMWVGNIQFYFPYIVGFAILAFGIPYVAKIAIPTFMSLSWRGNFWPKLWALFIALAVSTVIIIGTFSIQGETLMERDRESVVATQQAAQGRAVLQAQIEAAERRLSEMRNNPNAYMAQAASVGAAEWERSYVVQARQTRDPRLPMIERALGAARAADAEQQRLDGLRTQLAATAVEAQTARRVETEATSWLGAFIDWLQGVRAALLSFVMDIVCLIMPWIALRLEQARNRQLGEEAELVRRGVGEDHMVEDLRDQPAIARQDAIPQREQMFDAVTGERLYKRRATYAKAPKRKKTQVTLEPEPPAPDDRGVILEDDPRVARSDPPAADLFGALEPAPADHMAGDVAEPAPAPAAEEALADAPADAGEPSAAAEPLEGRPEANEELTDDEIEAFAEEPDAGPDVQPDAVDVDPVLPDSNSADGDDVHFGPSAIAEVAEPAGPEPAEQSVEQEASTALTLPGHFEDQFTDEPPQHDAHMRELRRRAYQQEMEDA